MRLSESRKWPRIQSENELVNKPKEELGDLHLKYVHETVSCGVYMQVKQDLAKKREVWDCLVGLAGLAGRLACFVENGEVGGLTFQPRTCQDPIYGDGQTDSPQQRQQTTASGGNKAGIEDEDRRTQQQVEGSTAPDEALPDESRPSLLHSRPDIHFALNLVEEELCLGDSS
ncbi:hypothetical protein AJ80_07190 [Polytolypa hystricis UAMH7299]|uniref:Uncharacterized protein n=1 Tax=Polytolypa hystricis (strain UAMH7299) TaxID=1447883 RepID=A0A2B7XRA3_POLH7|nr:hypothetical protein AJ80_07190 [Polytolypa hystricis UAMH7299]